MSYQNNVYQDNKAAQKAAEYSNYKAGVDAQIRYLSTKTSTTTSNYTTSSSNDCCECIKLMMLFLLIPGVIVLIIFGVVLAFAS